MNWEITNQAKAEGVMLLLPDVQSMRMLAAVLKVRVRGEIARGEFDNAIQTLQTMFALARTFNEHPTLIGHLVGMAIAAIAFSAVEEFVQQPGAPNLFWPLVDLPSPFIDLRKGREGEKLFLTKEYDVLRKAVPVPDADLQVAHQERSIRADRAPTRKKRGATERVVREAGEGQGRRGRRPRSAQGVRPQSRPTWRSSRRSRP